MAIVKTDVPMTYDRCEQAILNLTKTYPFLRSEVLTETAYGRHLRTLVIGNGPRKVIYSAAWHANEWITTPILLKFAENFAESLKNGGEIFGIHAGDLAAKATIYMVPMVDPTGWIWSPVPSTPEACHTKRPGKSAQLSHPSPSPTAGRPICGVWI